MLKKFFRSIGLKLDKGMTPALNDAVDKKEKELPYKIKIIRSNKRRRTISARLVEDTMLVYAPSSISEPELEKVIDKLKKRLHKRKIKKELNKTHDLAIIAEGLNKEYFDNRLKISSITYTTNQNKVFGSCNYKTKTIRISHRLTQMPSWVRDYVIIHEMAHLIEPNHSKAFWDIVSRFRLTERARGYLMAKGLDREEEPDDIEKTD